MPNPLRWVTVWAAVILFAIGSVWWTQQETARRSCEFGNDFRTEVLPAAFARHDQRLGEALGADQAQIDEFVHDFDDDLAEMFPARDC